MTRDAYNQYSDAVRREIVSTRNVKLYPELRIPKSTAYHWIKHGARLPVGKVAVDNALDQRTADKFTAFLECLTDALEPDKISDFQSEKIIKILSDKSCHLQRFVPKSFMKRIRQRVSQCKNSASGVCLRRYPRQLSSVEVAGMKEMIQSRRWAHLSICSLAWLAKRQGKLNCGVHTWYKYVAKYKWQRSNLPRVKPSLKYRGLLAKHVHEYWHQDVTKIRLDDGSLQSLQVILDNRSRAILSWKVSETVKAIDSAKLVALAKLKVKEQCEKIPCVHSIVDGGPENVGSDAEVGYKLGFPRVLRRIAQREIRHANTMVEVFFKALKSCYLNHRKLQNIEELRSAVNFYIDQHNNVIPKVALNGLTPNEVLIGVNAEQVLVGLQEGIAEARQARRSCNQRDLCGPCRTKVL